MFYFDIKKQISDKDTVEKVMGSPTFVSYIDDEPVWVYFSEEERRLLFFKPKILERKIMTLKFDKQSLVKDIKFYDLDDEQSVNFAHNYTKVESNKKGFFSELFGNIGQVRAN